MNEEKEMINCTRCGALMDKNERYCMKCGNLNYNHEANATIQKYLEKPKKQQMYEYNSYNNAFSSSNYNNETNNMSIANNTGSSFICFVFNLLLYVGVIGGLGYFYYYNMSNNLDALLVSKLPYIYIIITLIFIYIYSMELIFMKCNHRWWGAIIPIWNGFVLSDIVFKNMYFGLLLLIPGVNIIFFIVILYKLGEAFYHSGLLTVLIPYIYIPIIGFGVSNYRLKRYVVSNNPKYTERQYLYKKLFLSMTFLVLLASFGSIGYVNMGKIKDTKMQNEYYVMVAKKMVKYTKKRIDESGYNCTNGNVNGTGVYYFMFYDVAKYMYLPFYDTRLPIQGYVKVDYTNIEPVYYVTLSDNEHGFKNIEISKVDNDSVVWYKGDYSSEITNECIFQK